MVGSPGSRAGPATLPDPRPPELTPVLVPVPGTGYRAATGAAFDGASPTDPIVARALARILDPAAWTDRTQRRNNLTGRVRLEGRRGAFEVMVKEFPARSLRARLDGWWRGTSRAERAWRASATLTRHGIPTADPVLVLAPEGPAMGRSSYFVARHLDGAIELRRLVDALRRRRPDPELAGLDVMETIRAVGRLTRSLHDAGVWHRDLTAGNLLLWPWPDPTQRIFVVDLDRARVDQAIGPAIRIRELSRFPLFTADHRRALLAGYHGPGPVPRVEAALYHLHTRAFHLRARLRVQGGRLLARWTGTSTR